ncbi:MAG: DUF4065 domain-containing protein [Eubacterium sp.]|nr:DUF4065 domain-containing protein [Eubacterium sp.]
MQKYTLVKRFHDDCPVCGKTHEIEERKRISKIEMKGEEVSFEEHYYYCANASEEEKEFVPGVMLDDNLQNARNAYRTKMGLLTSMEIVAIRRKYGLSQVDFSKLLGVGEVTITRYETKAIQDEPYDIMLRLVKDNPLQALKLFERHEDLFTETKRAEIKARIIDEIDSDGKEYLSRQSFGAEYVVYSEPSDSNGYVVLNIGKIEAMVSYFAERVENLFKVKLMKMLWYADALFFKQFGKSMTGMVYRHEAMGALPIGHYKLMDLENIDVKEEMSSSFDLMLHVYPIKEMDYSVLNEDEKSILDRVVDKFKDFSTKEIVEYMHKEKAYVETEPGQIIPFSLARLIRDF